MIFRSVSLFLFGLALFYAPLAFGCTTRNTAYGQDILLLSATAAALLHKLVNRERFLLPRTPLLCVVFLAMLAVAHAVNARFAVDPRTLDLVPLPGSIRYLPAGLDKASATSAAFSLFALGSAFLALTDLAQHRRERWILLTCIAASGMLVALVGIGLKLQRSEIPPFRGAPYCFATYLYHGNAAAFLNLCWPAALALLARSVRDRNHLGRALWANGLLFTFGALFVNVSKFGHAAAIPAFLIAAWLAWRSLDGAWSTTSPVIGTVVGLVLLGALVAMMLPALAVGIERWNTLIGSGASGRTMAYQAALGILRDSPAWGIGPGCFRWAFPFYTAQLGEAIKGVWIHAHQDYIQTFAEWGIAGGSAWMILIGGGLWRGWRKLSSGARELSTLAAVIALSITAVHCLIDFPLQIASLRYLAAVHLALLWGGGSGRKKHES